MHPLRHRRTKEPLLKPRTENRQFCYFIWVAAACLLASGLLTHAAPAQEPSAAPQLTLDQFLSQVKLGNTGTQGSLQSSSGEQIRSVESQLITAPTAFANFSYSHDGKPQTFPLLTYDYLNTTTLNAGVSQVTPFGLQAKLSSYVTSIDYTNPALSPFLANGIPPGYAITQFGSVNTTTALELTQSIWGNGFGAATRANQDLIQSQAMAQSYSNRFTARVSLVDAESAYWRLATTRQVVEITRANLARAQRNYDWSARRAKLQLADRSDELQAQAQLEQRHLEYQQALDDRSVAQLAFNTARGVQSSDVPERLTELRPDSITRMEPPKRAEFRDDVKAAHQQQIATSAGAKVAVQRNTPTFDIFGTLAMNGQNTDLTPAYAQSYSLAHTTTAFGVRFSAPLTLGTSSSTREGYTREEAAADLTYERKVFEQDQGWKDLTERLSDSKRRLGLAVNLEKIQEAKLDHERERYHSGRSTAFQVLTFETDYALSQLNRIQTQSEVLGILTQMKLYGEEL